MAEEHELGTYEACVEKGRNKQKKLLNKGGRTVPHAAPALASQFTNHAQH